MRRRIGKLAGKCTAFSALVLALYTCPTEGKTPTTSQCWYIKQESCTIGVVRLYITDQALKLVSPKLGVTLLIHAPDWRLIAYNDSNKKFMQMSPEEMHEFIRRGEKLHGRTPLNDKLLKKDHDLPFEKLKTQTIICGTPTFEFHIPKKFNTTMGPQHSSNELGPIFTNALPLSTKVAKTYDPKKWHSGDEDCWVASNIVLPQKAVEFMSKKFGWPNLAGMHPMLRSVHIGEAGQCAVAFDTDEVKRIPVTPAMFEMPKGYSRTDNEMALMMDINEEDLDVLGGSEGIRQEAATAGSPAKSGPGSNPKPSPVSHQKPVAAPSSRH